MSPLCDCCGEHVNKLNQQVSVMRKEIKNLRQMLDSAVRAHRKHMASLQSAVSRMGADKAQTPSPPPPPPPSPASQQAALERGNIQTAPIGFISSCFSVKNGTPRQPTICGPSRAELRIQQSVFNNPDHALVGLEQYSHVWIIFLFHKNGHLIYKAKVKPPRLNGQRVGVYSTRSPHRPNALGLTLAKLDKIVGDRIYLSDIDMIDGTPVLDIKPYIPEYDSPHTRVGIDLESYDSNTDQPHAGFDEESNVLNLCEEKGTESNVKRQRTENDMGSLLPQNSSEADSSVRDSSRVQFPMSKDLHNVLEEVQAYVTQNELCQREEQVSDTPKTKPPAELTVDHPCFGEEAYSTIAGWITDPPVGYLDVRFTPHAERELAEFLPTHLSGSSDRPRFKFLHNPEEAAAAIRGVLSADPRSVYRRTRCRDRLFFFTLDTADITCWFGQGFAEVLQICFGRSFYLSNVGSSLPLTTVVHIFSLNSEVMSSRDSSFCGDALPMSRHGERTPLRSVENEVLHLSTPSSRLKLKSLLSGDVKMTQQGEIDLCDSEPRLNFPPSTTLVKSSASLNDVTASENTCGLGDVTLKSFLCAGGEVVISDSSVCAEESAILPNDLTIQNTETEDTVISDSMIVESSSQEVSSLDIDAALGSGYLDVKHNAHDLGVVQNVCSGEKDVIRKSFVCDGIAVEVSDVDSLQNKTIPLPRPQLCETSQDESRSSTKLFDIEQLNQVEPADHPYSSSENAVPDVTTFSQSPYNSEKPVNGLADVTLKSFNCTGGEIEISDGAKLADETVPLLINHPATTNEPYNYDINQSIIAGDCNVENDKDHFDHPYCNTENDSSTPSGNLKQICVAVPDIQNGMHEGIPVDSVNRAESEVKQSDTQLSSGLNKSLCTATSLKTSNDESVDCQVQEPSKCSKIQDSSMPSVLHKTESPSCNQLVSSAGNHTPEEVQQNMENGSRVHSNIAPSESCESKDSAIGSSGNGPVLCNSVENLNDVLKVLTECPSVASALQVGILSPVVRSCSLSTQKVNRDHTPDQFFADDSALEGEKSFVAPFNLDPAGLWAEHLESPMPRPLFNSTALGCKPQSGPIAEPDQDVGVKPSVVPQSKVEKQVLDIPVIQDGPLQQQLRQMAEFIILACGKMGPAAVSASTTTPPLPVNTIAPSTKATHAETHSVCVGTTAVQLVDHSLNTSGQFERKREFSVADSCTLTDPLLWNLPPGSLECLPRQELEQRLRSSMIMVEALVQQLSAARAHGCLPAGPAPSELREKLVQTDHTELSQTTMYRDLYLEALSRINDLELDGSSLRNLIQSMQDTKVTMTALSSDTDTALSNIKQMGDMVGEDHQSLVSHYGQMKSLIEKTTETQKKMMQKVQDALQQRNEMRTQMEDAFTAKEAAFSAMKQLRKHCATEISEFEKCVGSQQELLAALNQAYPEQVALNQAHTETLNSASHLLTQTMEEQSSVMKDLCTVRALLQQTTPMLLKLNEKAAAALIERDKHISARQQAVEEKEQIEEELSQTNLDLQTAKEQIGDLNLQVTILTSEMGVLRQKLTEREEERGHLERKVTELSATVSSTLASYAFLEQALASETTKLQQSWKDIQQAKDRTNELEMSLNHSEQRVCELNQALAQTEEQLSQLQTLSTSQKMQIQELQDVCKQLNGVREMNEFLQMENELAREQVVESERLQRTNLQGLRERNIQCEDLKGELAHLQTENRRLQEQLETTTSTARATHLELGEKLAQAVTEITLLHHTLRGLTNELHSTLNDQKPEKTKDKDSEPVNSLDRRHPASSFVDSIMVALTSEKEEIVTTATSPVPVPSDVPEPQCETLFSETSAFTRIDAVTPKKNLRAVEFEPEEEEQTSIAELLSDLGSTVQELVSTANLVRQHNNARLEELQNTICGLQGEQQAANSRHEAELLELRHQLRHLNSLVERGSQALQQKAQDEKTVSNLTAEIQEVHERLNKQKAESNELRKEVAELCRSLQQSKIECQFLREELRKAGGQSATPASFMEEKLHLLKEVERLKVSLRVAEQARVKLLERAKRHQVIHQTNQLKSENELQLLNNMINKVRETLLSLPEVVKRCEPLQQLAEYIG
ncbi:hypothetical protein Q5P01_025352 [Channa striata]|uniref:tRNA (adenine(37)-N6)-methyltransferase n=1 Tax=Channa striata TaxID=64152 RepID=A0AA88IN66_CHASR|nr:hypothetical protein Q5P01_025352 [Channa striata]